MKHALWILLLGFGYLAIIGQATWADIVMAALTGSAIVVARPRTATASRPLTVSQALAVPRFCLAVARELVRGSIMMLLVTMGARTWRRVGIVEVPIGERTPLGVVTSGLVLTATPGSILVDVDEDKKVMLVSVIDASDPRAIREDLDRFYQRYQKHVIP